MTYLHSSYWLLRDYVTVHVYSIRHRFNLILCATSHNDLVAATSLNKLR